MSDQMVVTLHLTGGREGKTCVLQKRRFVDGVSVVRGDAKSVAGIVKYFGRTYQAFPEGPELDAARKLGGDANGKRDLQSDLGRSPESTDESRVQSGGDRTAEVQTGAGVGPTDAETGGTGSLPAGDGHTDTGHDIEARKKERLAEVLKSLDHDDDEQWTDAGLPRLDVVEVRLGHAVSRAQVKAAMPELKRKT